MDHTCAIVDVYLRRYVASGVGIVIMKKEGDLLVFTALIRKVASCPCDNTKHVRYRVGLPHMRRVANPDYVWVCEYDKSIKER
jgi:hypothetical protein